MVKKYTWLVCLMTLLALFSSCSKIGDHFANGFVQGLVDATNKETPFALNETLVCDSVTFDGSHITYNISIVDEYSEVVGGSIKEQDPELLKFQIRNTLDENPQTKILVDGIKHTDYTLDYAYWSKGEVIVKISLNADDLNKEITEEEITKMAQLSMENEIEALKKQLPFNVDMFTKLVDARLDLKEKSLSYIYTLDGIDTEVTDETVSEIKRNTVIGLSNGSMRLYSTNNITLEYVYNDTTGNKIFSFTVTPDEY